MQFAEVFKLLCKEAGVTQQLALKEMGMGRNATQRWIDGMPSVNAMMKITMYFGVSSDLLYECVESDDEEWVRSLFVPDNYREDKNEETKNAPVAEDKRITRDDIKFALFKGADEITDEMMDEVMAFADFVAQREAKKKEKK